MIPPENAETPVPREPPIAIDCASAKGLLAATLPIPSWMRAASVPARSDPSQNDLQQKMIRSPATGPAAPKPKSLKMRRMIVVLTQHQ